MRETETLNPPWSTELVREDGRLVEITIRSTGGDELDVEAVRAATNAILEKLRQQRRNAVTAHRTGTLGILRQMYEAADGRMTAQYLATLAVAYEELAAKGRAIMPTLAEAIRRPAATVKGHVGKAREEGYLTKGTQGREGGEATPKARGVLRDYFDVDDQGRPLTSNERE